MQKIELYEQEYFQEKEDCVFNFISEEHFSLYLNHMLRGRSIRSINKALYFTDDKLISESISDDAAPSCNIDSEYYREMFFKEFCCKQDIPAAVLEKEIFRWRNYIEENSEFHVVFAVLAKDAFTNQSECFFLLREDREKEDFLRY